MAWRRHLLWIDGLAGASVGVAVLVLSGWLAELHALPRGLLLATGVANLAYGTYSLTLASSARRPMGAVVALVVANAGWAVVCAGLLIAFGREASVFGLLHLGGEGVFVGGLAALEWRWRGVLATAPRR